MGVKDHYENHLGNFYSWMAGDFIEKKEEFKRILSANGIKSMQSGLALDLGAGNGIQTMAMAESGFKVIAIDFNRQLLDELKSKTGSYPVEIIYDDLKYFKKYAVPPPELIICCGDTIAHLESEMEIDRLIRDISENLHSEGKLILTFRDYSTELENTNRFIPVKSDDQKILICFLEYFQKKVRVSDILYEKSGKEWIQKISSYEKTRVTEKMIVKILSGHDLRIIYNEKLNGMIAIIAKKQA